MFPPPPPSRSSPFLRALSQFRTRGRKPAIVGLAGDGCLVHDLTLRALDSLRFLVLCHCELPTAYHDGVLRERAPLLKRPEFEESIEVLAEVVSESFCSPSSVAPCTQEAPRGRIQGNGC